MPETELMIYLAHGDDARRRVVAATLELLTHKIGLSTSAPPVLIRRCQEHPPAVAIVGTDFEDDEMFDVLNQLSRENVCPIVALLKSADLDRSRRLIDDRVMGVLVEPVSETDLRTSIYLARRRFDQARRMEAKIDELQERLDMDISSEGDQ